MWSFTCFEDDPCWDPRTMGNMLDGTTGWLIDWSGLQWLLNWFN